MLVPNRVPLALASDVRAAAADLGMSLNAYVVAALQLSLRVPWRTEPPEAPVCEAPERVRELIERAIAEPAE